MDRKGFTVEHNINKLSEAEVLISQGLIVEETNHQIDVSKQIYYRWHKEYSELRLDQAKHFKDMEKEIARLIKVVADLALDYAIWKMRNYCDLEAGTYAIG